MEKIKNKLLYFLCFTFIASVILAFLSIGHRVSATVNLYPDAGLSAEVAIQTVNDNKQLNISVNGGQSGYEYQYWLKSRIKVDDINDNTVVYSYIWVNVKSFCTQSFYIVENIDETLLDYDGKYNIFVRIKDDNDNILDEIYLSYTPEQLGVPVIGGITVNGREIAENSITLAKGGIGTLSVNTSSDDVDFYLYNGNQLLEGPFTNVLNLADFLQNAGLYNLTLRAQNRENNLHSEKLLKVYLYEEYDASSMPVITSLTGISGTNGKTTFYMTAKLADGSEISQEAKDSFVFKLSSAGQDVQDSERELNEDKDTLEVEFSVDYLPNNYGIYYTVATVSRQGITGADDKIIIYYNGYIYRNSPSWAAQIPDTEYDSVKKGYVYELGDTVTIELDGFIDTVADPEAALYREDASGWVLIKGYKKLSEVSEFEWKPTRAGIYNIQLRIKDPASATYEALATYCYIIEGSHLSEQLSLSLIDYSTGKGAGLIATAGIPYILDSLYGEGSADALYMYTLTSKNLGTIYLSKYSVSSRLSIVFARPDDYVITVRAISPLNFGYKDISKQLAVSVVGLPAISKWTDQNTEFEYINGSEELSLGFSLGFGKEIFSITANGMPLSHNDYVYAANKLYISDMFLDGFTRGNIDFVVTDTSLQEFEFSVFVSFSLAEGESIYKGYLEENGVATLQQTTVSAGSWGAKTYTDFSYIALSGDYGSGYDVVIEFSGKNRPNIALFADDISHDLITGFEGLYVGDFNYSAYPGRITTFNIASLTNGNLDSPNRPITFEPTSNHPASYNMLDVNTNYIYKLSMQEAEGVVSIILTLINADTLETLYTSYRNLNADFTGPDSGNIIIYGSMMQEITFKYSVSRNIIARSYKVNLTEQSVLLGRDTTGTTYADSAYIEFDGEFVNGAYVMVEFTGQILPSIAFFSDNYTKNMKTGEKAMFISNDATITDLRMFPHLDNTIGATISSVSNYIKFSAMSSSKTYIYIAGVVLRPNNLGIKVTFELYEKDGDTITLIESVVRERADLPTVAAGFGTKIAMYGSRQTAMSYKYYKPSEDINALRAIYGIV